MSYILLIVGFVLLIKGADFFVEGSSSIAKTLKVPVVIIGLTIVAMGTSAPEAAVSITAGLNGNNEIAFSNIIGSNIFNLLVVLGICSLIKPLTVESRIVKTDFPFLLVITLITMLFAFDRTIGLIDGLVLVAVLILYIVLMVRSAMKNKVTEDDESIKVRHPAVSILFILGGAVAIVLGGNLVVNSASDIAASFGLSDTLIGLTIVAVGTSLPELVTSIVAARKGQTGLAIGNVVGSNIFNIAFILGISSVLHPMSIAEPTAAFGAFILPQAVIDVVFSMIVTLMVFLFCFKDKKISRWQGAVAVLLYAGYMVYAVVR